MIIIKNNKTGKYMDVVRTCIKEQVKHENIDTEQGFLIPLSDGDKILGTKLIIARTYATRAAKELGFSISTSIKDDALYGALFTK